MQSVQPTEWRICDYNVVLECARLCEWIYQEDCWQTPPTPSSASEIKHYEIISVESSKREYAILRASTQSKRDSIFVIFRGTLNLKDIITDFAVNLRKVEHATNGKVVAQTHSGFHNQADYHFRAIDAVIHHHTDKLQNIVLIGHSKGGAVAILHAFELLRRNISYANPLNLSVITFGAPLVFAEESSNEHERNEDIFTKLNHICHHFVNKYDGVPRTLGPHSWARLAAHAGIQRAFDGMAVHKRTYARLGAKSQLEAGVDDMLQILMPRLQSYYGVGTFYILHDQHLSIEHADARQLHRVLYAQDNLKPGEERAISSEFAQAIIENHSIEQYLDTLKTSGIYLQSAIADHRTKQIQRVFDEVQTEIARMKDKFENTEKSVQALKQNANSTQNSNFNSKRDVHALQTRMRDQETAIGQLEEKLNLTHISTTDEKYVNLQGDIKRLYQWNWVLTAVLSVFALSKL